MIVRILSTKEKPETLPVNCYRFRPSEPEMLDFSKTTDGVTAIKVTAGEKHNNLVAHCIRQEETLQLLKTHYVACYQIYERGICQQLCRSNGNVRKQLFIIVVYSQ